MSEEIADSLCKANVVSFGNFKLASGRESLLYVNLRILPSYPDIFNIVSDRIAEVVSNLGVDVIAGSESDIPLAVAVSLKTGIPMISVKKPTRFVRTATVIGMLTEGQKVALVTDIITNGYNKLKLIEGIREQGGVIENLISVIDKEEGASANLNKEGITLHSLLTLRGLLDHMRNHSMIEKDRYNQILEQMSMEQEYGGDS